MLISDEYTNPAKRRAMMEKRMRKVDGIAAAVPPPQIQGPANADVTLIGWGSTYGVIDEACELLARTGHLRESSADPLAGAAAWRRDPRPAEGREAHHHRGEQLQRPVCALSAQ